MRGSVGVSRTDIYEAVVGLSRSLAGRGDLESLLAGVGESLRRVVDFEYVGITLHDAKHNRMKSRFLRRGTPPLDFTLPVDRSPAGWVWLNQRPLVIRSAADQEKWPEFHQVAASAGVHAITLVPLTAGEQRIGAFGFGCRDLHEPSAAEMAFLERVASEFAVAVESFLARQALVQERDRLRTLFDITNALVSQLSPDDLFPAIAVQLARSIRHDFSVLNLRDAAGDVEMVGLHFIGAPLFDKIPGRLNLEGMPAAEALATGKPVIVRDVDLARYPSPLVRRRVEMGCKSACSVPLVTTNGTLGTLELVRTSSDDWSDDDVDFLVQVARQVAVAVETSLLYRELDSMKERLATEKLYLEDEIRVDYNNGNMVGEGPGFQSILKSIQLVAPTGATVLILGETGTGKELVARAIHESSGRNRGNFVKVNCAAIPASLLESELFGHEKGSFTGAVAQKIGRFELADKGTLFLDEIGEMPLELQPKLLRAVQDQEFERVGGTRTIRTNVRFVAATNRDLKAMVDQNQFRADLYFRLHVYPLNVPPLRDRREDIPLLTRYFVQKHAKRMDRNIERISTESLTALTNYDWPGNIRELQNVLERSVILTQGSELNLAMPDIEARSPEQYVRGSNAWAEAERAQIIKALKESNGKVSGTGGAAARLGLKRTTLQSRMRKYNIAGMFH